MKKNFNIPFLAFLAWMAALLTITCVNAFGQEPELHIPQDCSDAEATAVAVSIAKRIVWNSVAYVTVDSGIDHQQVTEDVFNLHVNQMMFAFGLLERFTYMSDEEIEIAMGVAGYDKAIEWTQESSIYGRIAKPAPEKRPAGVCCGDSIPK